MAATASRPAGLQKRRYAKLPTLKRARQPPALPSRFASYVQSAGRPSGVLAPGHQSGAARMVLVSGFAVHLVFAPAHPWGSLASQLRPRGLPVRPPRGLPQNRAKTRRLRRRPAGRGAGLDVGRYFTT